jgi:hypothetical protein
VKVDSRFSNKFVSRPFKGRKMDTPGTVDADADARGDRGRIRYRFRLRMSPESQQGILSDDESTHAVRHPKRPNDHRITYHAKPTTDKMAITWCCFAGALSESVIAVKEGRRVLWYVKMLVLVNRFGQFNHRTTCVTTTRSLGPNAHDVLVTYLF